MTFQYLDGLLQDAAYGMCTPVYYDRSHVESTFAARPEKIHVKL